MSPFELLELPDGRCYVARPSEPRSMRLVAGSFAEIEATEVSAPDPVGIYASREAAELAIQRNGNGATPTPAEPLAPFAAWLCRG